MLRGYGLVDGCGDETRETTMGMRERERGWRTRGKRLVTGERGGGDGSGIGDLDR
jgi:hypothetical protein